MFMLTKGSKQKHNIPYAWLKAIYTMLQIINPPCFQCVKRSHIFGVLLRSRSLEKKECTPIFAPYFLKKCGSLIDLPKKSGTLFALI